MATYQEMQVSSGGGFNSLLSAIRSIKAQLPKDTPGTLYEASVYWNAPSWMVGKAVNTANNKFQGTIAKPWPTYTQICMQDPNDTTLFYVRWEV